MSRGWRCGMAESRTAQFVAFYRALETNEMGREPLFRDPFAHRFLSPALQVAVWAARARPLRAAIVRYADHRAPGARTSAIGRTRFIDDVVRDRVAAGASQLVLLGAGYDCRPYRLPELRAIRTFEVDQPGMLARRSDRLGQVAARATHVTRVAIDFTRDDLHDRLARAGFDQQAPSVLVWEGVTNYLTSEAVDAVLGFVGRCGAGSTLVFTYIHRGVIDGSVRFDGADKLLHNVQRLGEPWRFGLAPGETPDLLRRHGLELVEDFGADEYRRRYLGAASSDLHGYGFYRIAVGRVAGSSS